MENNTKKGVAIASIVLGVFSVLCCCLLGIGIIPGIIGLILGVNACKNGEGSGRVMGIIGLVISGIGTLLSAYMLVSVGISVDWSNMTMEKLQSLSEIDTTDRAAVDEWLRQFLK